MMFSLFVSCPKGLEYLLEDELKSLGLSVTRVSPQGVYGHADLKGIYHVCLWSRLANRVQLILFDGAASSPNEIYALCHLFSWSDVFHPDKTLCVEFHGASPEVRHSVFGAQLVKDAIVDYFRETQGVRPDVDREHPLIRFHAYLKHDALTVSFDLTGYSMHQRGYRLKAGAAPLKENLAAAMLMRAQWPMLAEQGASLHDPCCGSGTLVIEAAMMAARVAPGLLRQDQSLQYWNQHQPMLWEEARSLALQAVKPVVSSIQGRDINPAMIDVANANAARAGVSNWVSFTHAPLSSARADAPSGLLISNPPYGERLNDETEWMPLYQELGQVLHAHYQGWHAAILTSNAMLAKTIGLRASKRYAFYNGALACQLYCMTLDTDNERRSFDPNRCSPATQMFANRLKKNALHLKKWANRNQIDCYRVYDADLPEYAFAIDVYRDYVVFQEYTAPASIDASKAEKRRLDAIRVVPGVLGIEAAHLVVKQRTPQKGAQQYQKINQMGRTITVSEGLAQFSINLYDYLDTGLFLDHRLLRLRFGRLPKNTRFLNCFCYTATASVHAALAGAHTTNVDLSNTYLNWARDNFYLNHLDVSRHQFIQYDCLEWLNQTTDRFDVIFLDPPSFSNSKRMAHTFDVQRDHESLISATMRLLNPNGVLYFSTNLRSFQLSLSVEKVHKVQDISTETIDVDFKRNPKIHRCFLISKGMEEAACKKMHAASSISD